MAATIKSQWFHILLALAEEDLHGHGIIRQALDASDGEVRLWPVTLYAALDELAAKGWIRELTGNDHPAGASHRRRYFRVKPAGRRALEAEARRLLALTTRALAATRR